MGDLPPLIRPMRAVLSHKLPVPDDQWGFEVKWDGVRAITYVIGKQVRALSRNDRDITASYPELAELTELVTWPVVLVGEIVTIRGGRPDSVMVSRRRPAGAGGEP
jgi:bifunctional non-homologous end joining protein LigD